MHHHGRRRVPPSAHAPPRPQARAPLGPCTSSAVGAKPHRLPCSARHPDAPDARPFPLAVPLWRRRKGLGPCTTTAAGACPLGPCTTTAAGPAAVRTQEGRGPSLPAERQIQLHRQEGRVAQEDVPSMEAVVCGCPRHIHIRSHGRCQRLGPFAHAIGPCTAPAVGMASHRPMHRPGRRCGPPTRPPVRLRSARPHGRGRWGNRRVPTACGPPHGPAPPGGPGGPGARGSCPPAPPW